MRGGCRWSGWCRTGRRVGWRRIWRCGWWAGRAEAGGWVRVQPRPARGLPGSARFSLLSLSFASCVDRRMAVWPPLGRRGLGAGSVARSSWWCQSPSGYNRQGLPMASPWPPSGHPQHSRLSPFPRFTGWTTPIGGGPVFFGRYPMPRNFGGAGGSGNLYGSPSLFCSAFSANHRTCGSRPVSPAILVMV